MEGSTYFLSDPPLFALFQKITNLLHFFRCDFARSQIKPLVDLTRVGRDDLAVELFCKIDPERALARGVCAGDNDQFVLHEIVPR